MFELFRERDLLHRNMEKASNVIHNSEVPDYQYFDTFTEMYKASQPSFLFRTIALFYAIVSIIVLIKKFFR